MSDPEYPLPPATFEYLTLSLKTQTEMHLGLIHFGDEKDRPEPDFRVARHSIDMLAMLAEKTRGNLSLEEQRLVENSLTELRFRYVQLLEAKQKTGGEPERAPATEELKDEKAGMAEPARSEEQAGSEGQDRS